MICEHILLFMMCLLHQGWRPQLFGLMIRVVYDVFVASWGDDLAVDMVPHVSRVGLGTLHV